MLAESGRVAKCPLSRSIALAVHPVHLEVPGQNRPLAKTAKTMDVLVGCQTSGQILIRKLRFEKLTRRV